MRILLVFFLSCMHPDPLISNYLAALGKGFVLSESSDATSMCCTESHSASGSNELKDCHLFHYA